MTDLLEEPEAVRIARAWLEGAGARADDINEMVMARYIVDQHEAAERAREVLGEVAKEAAQYRTRNIERQHPAGAFFAQGVVDLAAQLAVSREECERVKRERNEVREPEMKP